MAQEIESKAHNDKPIYAAAMRLGIIDPGNSKENDLRGLEYYREYIPSWWQAP